MVLGLLREDVVEVLLARLRLLRGRSCAIESSDVCFSLFFSLS